MQVVQSKPVMQYSQTNGTIVKTGGGKKIVVEQDSGEDEEIEETETIIKKTIIRKKAKKTYVRFEKFTASAFEEWLKNFIIAMASAFFNLYSREVHSRKFIKLELLEVSIKQFKDNCFFLNCFDSRLCLKKALAKLNRGELSFHKSKVLTGIQCSKSGVIISQLVLSPSRRPSTRTRNSSKLQAYIRCTWHKTSKWLTKLPSRVFAWRGTATRLKHLTVSLTVTSWSARTQCFRISLTERLTSFYERVLLDPSNRVRMH